MASAALQSARDAGAASASPELLATGEDAFLAAQKEIARQLARMRWNRDYSRSEAWLDTALRRARLAEEISRSLTQDTRRKATELMGRAETSFAQMEWVSAYIPPRSPIRADVSRARVSYEESRVLFNNGQFARAVKTARGANEILGIAYGRFARLIEMNTDPSRGGEYDRWIRETISWSKANRSGAIIVDKMRRTLTWVASGQRVKSYRAELGLNGIQSKTVSGDRATPEGRYRITEKRGPRQTRWYKALLINYPNADDLERFHRMRRRGQISGRARPGSLIEIHGEGGRGGDWTEGCVALVNRDIDDLFDRVSVGTPVTIVGFEHYASLPVDPGIRKAARAASAARRATSSGGR